MIKVLDIQFLSRKNFRRLNAMTLGSRGLMQYYLESAYEKDKHRLRYRRREMAYVLYSNKKIIGWRLLLQCRKCSICKWKTVVHIFVREKFRGNGYGRVLIQRIIDLHPGEQIYCHGNNNFFKQFNIKNVN